MPRESFGWAEEPLRIIREWNISNDESIAAGGNVCFAQHGGEGIEMLISQSGQAFHELTLQNMCLTSVQLALGDMANIRDDVDEIREQLYEQSRVAAAQKQGGKNSIEHPGHALLAKRLIESKGTQGAKAIVYHPHRTELSAVLAAYGGLQLLIERLGEQYIGVKARIPGIGLGQTIQEGMKTHKGGLLGVAQEGHGMWMVAPDIDTLSKRRIYIYTQAKDILEGAAPADIEERPYGDYLDVYRRHITTVMISCVMESIYEKVFGKRPEGCKYEESVEIEPGFKVVKMSTNKGVLYFNTTNLARKYASSERAMRLAGHFARTSPDSIVLAGPTDTYCILNDPTDIHRTQIDIQAQIHKNMGNMYSRTFVIQGLGIVTVGGHYASDGDADAAARNAAVMVNNTLKVEKYAAPFGSVYRWSEKDTLFIAEKWSCEKERRAMMHRGR